MNGASHGRIVVDETKVWRAHVQGVATQDIAVRFGVSRRSVSDILARIRASQPDESFTACLPGQTQGDQP